MIRITGLMVLMGILKIMESQNIAELKKLPLRENVGIMLLNKKGRVWVGRRLQQWMPEASEFVWQMPQGGIDKGESPKQAALRELYEETGVRTVTILAKSSRWLSYELPDDALGIALKGKYRGQVQKWFVMRFDGEDSEISLDCHGQHKPEFDSWKWVKLKKIPKLVVPFKREVYEQLVLEFKYLVKYEKLRS